MIQYIKKLLKKIPPFKQIEYVKADLRKTIQGLNKLKEELDNTKRELNKVRQENAAQKEIIKTLRQHDASQEKVSEQLRKQYDHQNQTIAGLGNELKTCKLEVKKDSGDIKNLYRRLENLDKRTTATMHDLRKDIKYYYWKNCDPKKYPAELEADYLQTTGKKLNLENPETYNEKIQWMKLYDSTPEKTFAADKYLVKDWVAEKIGREYIIPTLGAWDTFDEIDFDQLPQQFVLKTNHGSGYNLVVKDKDNMNLDQTRAKFMKWMNRNYAFHGLELHYANIPRKIMAEKYISELDTDIYDYRFFCFSGEPKYVWVDVGSGTSAHKRSIYNMDWELQECRVSYDSIDPAPEKPGKFEEMTEIAKTLSQGFAHVRVDLYYLNDKIYFGEMTFTHQNGMATWKPSSWDKIYGDLIQLPEKKDYLEFQN